MGLFHEYLKVPHSHFKENLLMNYLSTSQLFGNNSHKSGAAFRWVFCLCWKSNQATESFFCVELVSWLQKHPRT